MADGRNTMAGWTYVNQHKRARSQTRNAPMRQTEAVVSGTAVMVLSVVSKIEMSKDDVEDLFSFI